MLWRCWGERNLFTLLSLCLHGVGTVHLVTDWWSFHISISNRLILAHVPCHLQIIHEHQDHRTRIYSCIDHLMSLHILIVCRNMMAILIKVCKVRCLCAYRMRTVSHSVINFWIWVRSSLVWLCKYAPFNFDSSHSHRSWFGFRLLSHRSIDLTWLKA